MRTHHDSASRAITDYFNSPAWHAPHESDLLAAIMRELMDDGQPATNKAVIARVITRLEVEGDEQRLQSYRNLLAQLLEAGPQT
ncbi:biofilm development regulator YmgB/AriR family protein [Pantoea dispersa]|uniref:biofilm development regulator YmgB/AriR family protein n=1 Tax=Pantoea dispersa TaxID=59814 RepID=UPI002DBAC5C9|nr:biofilm development regulator YmgB/AriR family protein [Pantoea dispersa]MEB5973667.1 biofilm development regulator YmgB/AriR family protein [Pantoea dispersa]